MAGLMIQGTTSDAGKSTLVAGLGRVLHRRGIRVAPFKPQNMALNSAVTLDGGEIGRAQAVQAMACGIDPQVDMNPVLIKPESDTGAQIILAGRVHGQMNAVDYHAFKTIAMETVMAAWRRLLGRYETVLVEGAGSPAEINLRDNDIANMGFAEAADVPVVLIADIDRGGVFAHLYGTLELLSPSEQQRVVGFVINRFRGDKSLLQSGLDWLEQNTAKPVLGVLPYLQDFHLEAEDAIQNIQLTDKPGLRVVVPVLPRISNHTDFDPLRLHPDIDLVYVGPGQSPPPADLVILPGSKSVRDDLEHLLKEDWGSYLSRHLRYGGKVLGICGGYQMLGRKIHDPGGIEGQSGSSDGLGWLDIETTLLPEKQLHNVGGHWNGSTAEFTGYEIHCGVSTGAGLENPMLKFHDGRHDGCVSEDGQVMGCYVHGFLDQDAVVSTLIHWCGTSPTTIVDYQARRERDLDRLADCLEQHMEIDRILDLLANPPRVA